MPGQFGQFPEWHSHAGVRPYLGSGLPDIERYEDLFLHRHPKHAWLLDSRARDALNAHAVRIHGGHPVLAHETLMGRRLDQHRGYQTTTWHVHAYLHADDADVLPLDEQTLDGLQFGGKRNYGYGEVQLKDTQIVDLETLDYSRLATTDVYQLELVTPFVCESTYPDTSDVPVPWWWHTDRDELRERTEQVWQSKKPYRLQIIDHGQVVTYVGDRPVETAKNGIRRVGTHSKYGFGELRVRPGSPVDSASSLADSHESD